ncbi:MAG: hypothetical protein LIO71_02610 [Ruminococcus sp.]|nr:hypothetical protein [Ruminococcus sp.]
MRDYGLVEIRVSGTLGNQPLSPENFDIREIEQLFHVIQDLLYPNQKATRSPITFSYEPGSVRNIFRTSAQNVLVFSTIIGMVSENGNLDGLELPVARALDEVQRSAVRNNFTYEFGIPEQAPQLTISNSTNFYFNDDIWADAEFYLYGTLISAGGKDKSSIRLNTEDYGILTISTNQEFLRNLQQNVLYKRFAVHAMGRQNIFTGEMDPSNLQLLKLSPHHPYFDENYINQLIKRATPHWAQVEDVDQWMAEIRGIDE